MEVVYKVGEPKDEFIKYNELEPYEVYRCVAGPDGYVGKHLRALYKCSTSPYGVWFDLNGVLADMTMDKEKLRFKKVKAYLVVDE